MKAKRCCIPAECTWPEEAEVTSAAQRHDVEPVVEAGVGRARSGKRTEAAIAVEILDRSAKPAPDHQRKVGKAPELATGQAIPGNQCFAAAQVEVDLSHVVRWPHPRCVDAFRRSPVRSIP